MPAAWRASYEHCLAALRTLIFGRGRCGLYAVAYVIGIPNRSRMVVGGMVFESPEHVFGQIAAESKTETIMPLELQDRRMSDRLAGVIDEGLDLAEECGWRYAIVSIRTNAAGASHLFLAPYSH